MRHREYHAHREAEAHARCQRTDWAMRQYVDEMRQLLSIHPEHDRIGRLMTERGVPADVQRRVLAGH
ncbi:MAG TPA: hypothetical protein PLN31_09465 [Azoarcus taiwanensis]|nr:hypothetical protein [Azoarcus taiwanensis]